MHQIYTAWKVSKYGVFSAPYFPAFGPEKALYLDTFETVIVTDYWYYTCGTKIIIKIVIWIISVKFDHQKQPPNVFYK